jgi:hypothetical protein
MRGDWLALGAVGALAAGGLLSKGSRSKPGGSVESAVERPRVLFNELPEPTRATLERAGEAFRKIKSGPLGEIFPTNMTRAMAFREAKAEDMFSGNLLFEAMLGYVTSGQQTFVVGPEMQQQLVRTSMDSVQPWMISLPYESFFIALPECDWSIWGTDGRMLKVRGVAVDRGFRVNTLSMVIWAPTDDPERTLRRVVTPDQARTLNANPALLRAAKANVSWTGNDSYLNVDLEKAFAPLLGRPHGDLEGWLEQSWGEARHHPDLATWDERVAEETAQTRAQVLRVVLGVLFYLQADGADLSVDAILEAAQARSDVARAKLARVKSASKKKKLERKQPTMSTSTVVWLGRQIEEDALRREGGERSGLRRHWVRGHWKGVARKAGRVIVWVQPYERGQGPGAVTSRTYRFEGDRG